MIFIDFSMCATEICKLSILKESLHFWPNDIGHHRSGSTLAQVLNSFLTDSTKPLPEPMLTFHQWDSVAFTWEQFYKKCSRIQFLIWNRKLNILKSLPHLPGAILSWISYLSLLWLIDVSCSHQSSEWCRNWSTMFVASPVYNLEASICLRMGRTCLVVKCGGGCPN